MISVGALADSLGADPSADAVELEELRDAALELLERQTGRRFGEPEERSEVLPGSGTVRLILAEPPHEEEGVTVQALRYHGDEDPEEVSDYTLRGRSLLRHKGRSWQRGLLYEVTYTAGYKEDEGPAEVRRLLRERVAWAWRREQDGEGEGIESESMGDRSVTYASEEGSPWSADHPVVHAARRGRVG